MTKRKGSSLSAMFLRKCVTHIQERRMSLQNEMDGCDDVWQDADFMAQHIRSVDNYARRMKFNQVKSTVEQAIAEIKAYDPESDLDETSLDSDFDDLDPNTPMMVVQDTNMMNRSILKRYTETACPEVTSEKATSSAVVAVPSLAEPAVSDGTAALGDEPAVPAAAATSNGTTKPQARKKRKVSSEDYPPPDVRYADLGGIDKCIEEVRELIEAPIAHPEVFAHLNIAPPRGVLLHGPPGCGKTQLARAVAGELGVPFIQISAPSVVSGMSGESEKKIREIFKDAVELAPCLLFIDEIDAITPKRENAQREMERRIVAQLLTCMDDLCLENTNQKPVIVIGATNRPDALDAALRRAGRFDREISMGIPDEHARQQILKVLTAKLRLSGVFDFQMLAKITPGYVGADLRALTTAAGMFAVKRIFGLLAKGPEAKVINETQQAVVESERQVSTESMDLTNTAMEEDVAPKKPWETSEIAMFLHRHPDPLTESELRPLAITMDDFHLALKKVQPSSKREGFATVPDVSWSDIGALASIRESLRLMIVEPIKHPEMFARVGIQNPSGVLLWGAPGCGKTLLAKAVANESHCNFISVKGPELLNKYVGESERGVRQVFARARASAPCIIFFDELDALCPRRGDGSDSQTSERVVNQLLTEMDGLESRKAVYIIAATNRPDIIDRAILRPGRLDKLLYVELPTAGERYEILKTLCANVPLHPSVDLHKVAHHPRCQRLSGADLSSLIRESGLVCLQECLQNGNEDDLDKDLAVTAQHFETALHRISPSVSEKDLQTYENLNRKLNY